MSFAIARISTLVVAIVMVAADVALKVSGHPSSTFDSAVPVVVAFFLGGHIAGSSSGTTSGGGPA